MKTTRTKKEKKIKMISYIIRDMEAGNKIEICDTFEEAEKQVKQFEQDDKKNGCYTPDFYEIVEENN
jgi:hypothetical protein